ncbi:lytic transglycosylase domain-containing protein [Citrobacter farmeri]
MKVLLNALLLLMALGSCGAANAFCFREAADKYGVPVALVVAISNHESSLNPRATNVQSYGTDYGLMQINSNHIPKLIKMGVIKSAEDLFKPCLNVQIGTWILATHLAKCGYTWECIGSYNAGFRKTKRQEERRKQYAGYIKGQYKRMGIEL